LGKFSAVLAVGAVAGALAARTAAADLRKPAPWLAALLAATGASPVWILAALHHGDNLMFQLRGRHELRRFPAAYRLEFLGAHLLLATPPLGAGLAWAWWMGWRRSEPGWKALAAGAMTPIAAFGAIGLFERIGPHWSGPGLILMTVALALVSFPGKRGL